MKRTRHHEQARFAEILMLAAVVGAVAQVVAVAIEIGRAAAWCP